MLKKYKEPVLLLAIMGFAIFMLLEANNIHVGTRSRTPVGPAVWPRVMLGGLFLFSLILFVIDLRRIRKGESLETEKDPAETADMSDLVTNKVEHPQRGLYTLLFLIVYLVLLPIVGFVFSSSVLLFVYLLSLRVKLRQSFLLATISTAVLTYLFPHVLSVPLPRGIGLFQAMTKILY